MTGRILAFILCGLALWPGSARADSAGLLIYQEPPSSYTEAFEYRSIRKDNVLYFTLFTADGQTKRLQNGGIIATIAYPPPAFDADFSALAESTIGKLKGLALRYPKVKDPLDLMLGKWERAASVYAQTRQPAAAQADAPADVPELTVGGTKYQSPRLLTTDAESAEVAHRGGIVRVRIADLTPDQMAALNATSKTARIAPAPASAPVDAQVPENSAPPSPGSLTAHVSAAGAHSLRFIALKTGLTYETVSVWIPFAIMPALVVVLTCLNVSQKLKIRALSGTRIIRKP